MSKAENREAALSQALRKELKGSSITPSGLDALERRTPGKGRIDVLLELLAKPDDEIVHAEAAAVMLERGPRMLRYLAKKDKAKFGPDVEVGPRKVRGYSIGRLRQMRKDLDLELDALVRQAAERREAVRAGERIEEKSFTSIEELDKAVLAGLSPEGGVIEIIVRYRVPAMTTPVAGFVCAGLHELLTAYVWEDPDLLLDWQNAYRVVVLEVLADDFIAAHAVSSSARVRRVIEGGPGAGEL